MAKLKEKSKKRKVTILTYMNDILFKYLLTQLKARDSKRVLNFITKNVLKFVDKDLVAQNPNMNPQHFKQKNITVDTLFKSAKHMVIIEMQATKMCQRLWNRFILYLSLIASTLINRGQDYDQAIPTYMILFAKEYDKRHPSLIVKKTWMDQKYKSTVNQNCQTIYLVQIPYIKEIVKKRKKLTDFEAFVYYLYYNNLDDIECDDKDGILELMQREKEIFMREEKEMYEAALDRLNLTIDYDELLKENTKEERAKAKAETKRRVSEAKKQADKQIQQANERADKAMDEAKEAKDNVKSSILTIFKKDYPKENTSFLNHLSLNQYLQILSLLINKESLDKIKAIAL